MLRGTPPILSAFLALDWLRSHLQLWKSLAFYLKSVNFFHPIVHRNLRGQDGLIGMLQQTNKQMNERMNKQTNRIPMTSEL